MRSLKTLLLVMALLLLLPLALLAGLLLLATSPLGWLEAGSAAGLASTAGLGWA